MILNRDHDIFHDINVFVVFLASSHRCRFLTSSQSREGRKIPKKGLSLFSQVILGGVCPPFPLLCTHTNTQTCKHMASADLSTISHGYAGMGSCFRSWLTQMHTSHWDEQHRSLRTKAIDKMKMRRARQRYREIETRFPGLLTRLLCSLDI